MLFHIFPSVQKSTGKGKGKRKPKSRAEVIENDNSSGSEDLHSKDETNDSVSLDMSRVKKEPMDTGDKDKKEESEISDLEVDEEAEGKKKGKKSKARSKKEKKEKKTDKGEGAKVEEGAKKEDGKKKKGKKKVRTNVILGSVPVVPVTHQKRQSIQINVWSWMVKMSMLKSWTNCFLLLWF